MLQEHSHPFDDVPGYIEAATTLVSSSSRSPSLKIRLSQYGVSLLAIHASKPASASKAEKILARWVLSIGGCMAGAAWYLQKKDEKDQNQV